MDAAMRALVFAIEGIRYPHESDVQTIAERIRRRLAMVVTSDIDTMLIHEASFSNDAELFRVWRSSGMNRPGSAAVLMAVWAQYTMFWSYLTDQWTLRLNNADRFPETPTASP